MSLCPVAQSIQYDAGLDASMPLLRVQLQNLVHVLAEVEHNRDVAALPGEAGPGSARQYRRADLPARTQGRRNVLQISRYHQPDRHLPVVRGIRGVKRAAAVVEANLTANCSLQFGFECARLVECL